jgi:hypothetical protein
MISSFNAWNRGDGAEALTSFTTGAWVRVGQAYAQAVALATSILQGMRAAWNHPRRPMLASALYEQRL